MGVPSLNDLAVDGMLNTTNQPIIHCKYTCYLTTKKLIGIIRVELAWLSGNVMDCHATARGSIPGRNGVFIELHVLRKGQKMGLPSLNDLAVDGTLNTTNQPKIGIIR